MSKPQRSLRLEKRSAKSLSVLSGAPGEIFFDNDNGTLRVYTDNAGDSIIMANRQWVIANTFSGNYNDLTNVPAGLSDFANDANFATQTFVDNAIAAIPSTDLSGLATLGDLSTIGNLGDVDTATTELAIGDILQYDGTDWVNTPLTASQDTTYALSSAAGAAGIDLKLTDVDGNIDTINLLVDGGLGISATALNQITITGTGLASLTDISVDTVIITQTFGSLSYDNTTGVFTFTPPDGAAILTNSSGFGVQAATVATTGAYSDLTGTPTLAAVATSGAASDVGLGNVTNESKATMFAGPNFTGTLSLNSQLVFETPSTAVDRITGNGTLGFQILTADNPTGRSASISITPGDSNTFNSISSVSITGSLSTDLTSTGGHVLVQGGRTNTTASTAGTGGNVTIVGGGNLSSSGIQTGGNVVIDGGGQLGASGTAGSILIGTNSNSGGVNSSGTASVTIGNGLSTNYIFGKTEYKSTIEVVYNNAATASGTVTHPITQGNIMYHSAASANFTVNYTGIPTTSFRTMSMVEIINQGTTAFLPTAVQIDGVAQTIIWQGGSAPTGTVSGVDVVSFNLIRTSGAWKVLGSATGYA